MVVLGALPEVLAMRELPDQFVTGLRALDRLARWRRFCVVTLKIDRAHNDSGCHGKFSKQWSDIAPIDATPIYEGARASVEHLRGAGLIACAVIEETRRLCLRLFLALDCPRPVQTLSAGKRRHDGREIGKLLGLKRHKLIAGLRRLQRSGGGLARIYERIDLCTDARQIIREVARATSAWRDMAAQYGAPAAEIRRMESAFKYGLEKRTVLLVRNIAAMMVFIDEGGHFTENAGTSVLCALSIPSAAVDKLRHELTEFTRNWPRKDNELKGGLVTPFKLQRWWVSCTVMMRCCIASLVMYRETTKGRFHNTNSGKRRGLLSTSQTTMRERSKLKYWDWLGRSNSFQISSMCNMCF